MFDAMKMVQKTEDFHGWSYWGMTALILILKISLSEEGNEKYEDYY